jgi:DNA-directed RNA polymerase subunit RPC12/RpoP
MQKNFKCLDCSHQFYVPRFSFNSKLIYISRHNGKRINCPECSSEQIEFIEQKTDFSTVLYGKFSSASDEEKKNILRKRAKEHDKKTEEQYRTIDKEYKGRVNEKHY